MSIVLFVDSERDRQDEAIECAIAVAAFCNARREPLYLTCDAATALEIGVSLLGTRQARTVDGGAYAPSTLRLLPALRRSGAAAEDFTGGPDDKSGGGVEELLQLGLFARSGEGEGTAEFGDDPALAIERTVATLAPSLVIGLGRESPLWPSLARGAGRAASRPVLLEIEGFAPTRPSDSFERVQINVPDSPIRSEDRSEDEIDDFVEVQRRAERTGALVGRLFDELARRR